MPETTCWTEFPELTRPALLRQRRGTVAEFLKAWGPFPPRVPGDKESLPLVSPAEWPDGGRSGATKPILMHAVVLDFDFARTVKREDGTRAKERHEDYLDDAAFTERLRAAKVPLLDYLTYSAEEGWLRRRVVSALARPVEPERYPALVRLYARALGFEREWLSGAVDASCQEPKRCYFAAHDERGMAGKAAFSHAVPRLIPSRSVDLDTSLEGFAWDWQEQDLREVQLELSAADAAGDDDPRALAAVTEDVLAHALQAVDPHDREVWYRVGSALKTWALRRDGRPDRGWQLWEQWSKGAPDKWDERDARKNWKSFEPERVSPGTIIHLARQAGWRMSEVERLNEQFFTVPVGGVVKVARIVPQAEVDGWVPQDLPGIQLFGDKAFCARFQEWIPVKAKGEDGQPVEKRVPLGRHWLNSPKRRHYPNGFRFDYATTEHRDGYYNLFQGFAVKPDPLPFPEARCGRILAHAKDVICAGDDLSHQYLLNWLAWKLQRPHRKIKTAVAVRGLKGVGKDAFFELMVRIIGTRCAFVLDDTKKFEKTFNAFLADKCLIVMDEANLLGHDVEEKLKHYVTQESVTVERKGVDMAMARNYADFVIYTNREAVVNVTADERRYFVLECSPHRRGDEAYFDAYFREVEEGGLEAFMAFLLQRDLSEFRPSRVPITPAHRQQYLVTQQPGLLALRDWLLHPTFWDVDVFAKAGGERGGRNASWIPLQEVDAEDGWPEGCAVRQAQLAEYLVKAVRQGGGLQRMNSPQRVGQALRDVFGRLGADRTVRLPILREARGGKFEVRAEAAFILPTLAEARKAFDEASKTRTHWPEQGLDGSL